MIIVYLIRNDINKKIYIGQTCKPLQTRLSQHKSCAKLHKNNCIKLENAINKYGAEHFAIEQLSIVIDRESANKLEIELIAKYNSIVAGYNIQSGGQGNRDICGALNPQAKLTEKEMKKIFYLASNKIGSQLDIAKQFNINRTTVQRILYNRSWISQDRQGINVKNKLTMNDVKEIKILLNEEKLSYTIIAKKYNVSKSMIAHISKGRIYSDI